ncbi:MAG: site-specific DNA-methyltransferase [Moraxella sp.]|nr:site-specific DNA-methyltransferase [Moraxella sp.]
MQILPKLNKKSINMVFADPPYFLSNNGLTVKNGIIQSVNKGDWDSSLSVNDIDKFTYNWLLMVREVLADNGTIWISGTHHNIFTLGKTLEQLGFKILNMITWEKPNPPPNFSCRYFTYSTEWIIWARKYPKIPHYFDYQLMKRLNSDKQMKDVWRLPAVQSWEKQQGKHPTQKPLGLLSRIILASTQKDDLILDPFAGSATTGIAAHLLDRKFVGIEQETEFLTLAKRRFLAINEDAKIIMKQKIREQISLI